MVYMVLTVLFAVLLGALFFVFWIIMLVDACTRKFKESNDKVVWVLVNIFAGLIGSLIYYFVVYWKDKSKSMKWFWWTVLVVFVLLVIFGVLFVIDSIRVYGNANDFITPPVE